MNKQTAVFFDKQWQVVVRDEADRSVLAEITKHREYRIAENYIKQCQHAIIDGGAHAGFFSMYARALNEQAQIIAVEPEENNQKTLANHLAWNKITGVKLMKAALAKTSGTGNLQITEDTHNHYLVAEADKETKKVSTVSFADLCAKEKIDHVSLIKLDIEGGEYDFLAGFSEADFGCVGALIMEYHTVENKTYKIIETKLREHGFGVQVFPSHFDRTMGFLWAVNKRHPEIFREA